MHTPTWWYAECFTKPETYRRVTGELTPDAVSEAKREDTQP